MCALASFSMMKKKSCSNRWVWSFTKLRNSNRLADTCPRSLSNTDKEYIFLNIRRCYTFPRHLRFVLPFCANFAILKQSFTLMASKQLLSDKEKIRGLSQIRRPTVVKTSFFFLIPTFRQVGQIGANLGIRRPSFCFFVGILSLWEIFIQKWKKLQESIVKKK